MATRRTSLRDVLYAHLVLDVKALLLGASKA